MKQIYIIHKYVVANSIKDAIKNEAQADVTNCFLSEHSLTKYLDSKHV